MSENAQSGHCWPPAGTVTQEQYWAATELGDILNVLARCDSRGALVDVTVAVNKQLHETRQAWRELQREFDALRTHLTERAQQDAAVIAELREHTERLQRALDDAGVTLDQSETDQAI